MDFSFTTEQDELRELVARILADTCTADHLRRTADTDTGVDQELWRTLAAAGAAGIALPEAAAGGGLGGVEAAIVLEEIGRAAAPVPAFAVMALAAPALARAGRVDRLAGVADGDVIVTAALHEPTGDVWSPATAVTDGRLTGVKVCVPNGVIAHSFLVSAADGLYVVDAGAPGVTVTAQATTSGMTDAHVAFDGAPCERLGGPDATAEVILDGIVGACVLVSGSCQAALALTAAYAVSRRQFDKPIASFQAVSQRAGDAYIDTEGVRLTAWQAAWRRAVGMPHEAEVLTAKFWAAEGGWRVMHAAQHIHGGFGVDRDYPLHRHFLTHKQLELQLGSATPSLLRLGKMLADQPI